MQINKGKDAWCVEPQWFAMDSFFDKTKAKAARNLEHCSMRWAEIQSEIQAEY